MWEENPKLQMKMAEDIISMPVASGAVEMDAEKKAAIPNQTLETKPTNSARKEKAAL